MNLCELLQVGVGILEGHGGGVSWYVFMRTVFGWVLTIILSLGFCAALFSAGEIGTYGLI